MTSTLSAADVKRLLVDPSEQTRAGTAGKVAAQLDSAGLSEAERQIALDIVRVMVRDAAVRVREALSMNLKSSTHLPHDVALALAQDVESVALPMLQFSAVLTDDDLVEIVRRSGPAKQIAVARRADLSAPVADALIDSRNGAAVATLVENPRAALSEGALHRIVDQFGEQEAIQGSIVHRANLPVTVAERLVATVSESLRDYLVTHHELPSAVATDLILESRERATVSLLPPGMASTDVEKLVHQLKANGRLSPSIILRALCLGDLVFFEASLALLSGNTLVNARTLIYDDGPLGLRSIYRRANLPERLYPAFRVAVDVARETGYDGLEKDRERHVCRMIERILTQFEDLGQDNLDYLLKKLSQFAA